MYIDAYYVPPPARSNGSAQTRAAKPTNFVYTGDTFVFTGPTRKEPPRELSHDASFWAWLTHLFG